MTSSVELPTGRISYMSLATNKPVALIQKTTWGMEKGVIDILAFGIRLMNRSLGKAFVLSIDKNR
jgi:hypothetical protein